MSLTPLQPPRKLSQIPVKKEVVPAVTALHDSLKQIEDRPNVLTLSQFRQFEPLFRKEHGLNERQIDALTEMYRKLVDFYKPTVIIRSATDRAIILTLPPLFTPVRSLSPTEKNITLVAINRNLSGNSIPLYSSTAFGRMARALIEEQAGNKEVVDAYRGMYADSMKAFSEVYNITDPQKTDTPVTTPESKVFEETTWELE